MRGFLINKNLCFYYWLRNKIGKKWACKVAVAIEDGILLFGRPVAKDSSLGEQAKALQGCRGK
jgi:hypothetical protein